MKKTVLSLIVLLLTVNIYAQEGPHSHRVSQRVIEFPDIPGYQTLVCDFHQHTVFSDGNVWPSIRVLEALRDGLDAISLTDHLEYQPHKQDIPNPDRNRTYQIALEEAKNHDLIVVNGSEITRSMPPGHTNAIFISDANKLLNDDVMKVFKEANDQGAFVFWNHPNWIAQKPDGIAELTDMHRTFIKNKWLHGIEVVNETTYSDEALQIALDNDLTLMGTSDIHGLIDWTFDVPDGGHRPVTLVFAKDRSEAGIKAALFNKQTVVYHNELIIGRDDFLIPLIEASIVISDVKYQGKSTVLSAVIYNNSDVDLLLENLSDYTFHEHGPVLTLKSKEPLTLHIKTREKLDAVDIPFRVLNAIDAPKKHPVIRLNFKP
ncbi:MAG: PHP domain-containing protein [Flavobacteriaceae bacterium]|nr:PHP domain-containing protein [Flavobacteriaceae bacterium]